MEIKISNLDDTPITIDQKILPIEALYEAHQHPLVKVKNCGNKFYIPKSKDDEDHEVEENLANLKAVLKFPRVERRSFRGSGIFLEEERLVKLTKDRFQKFGFNNKSGKYLILEEALFLLETNRLEIFWNDVPMSVQQAYNLFLDNENLTLHKYLAYKKLAVPGYQLKREEKYAKEDDLLLEESPSPKKRKLDRDSDVKKEDESKTEINNKITKLFEKLRQKVPKEWNEKLEKHPDYIATDKKQKLNVYLQGQEMDPKIGTYEEKDPNIFALKIDSTPLYHFSKVKLPQLL